MAETLKNMLEDRTKPGTLYKSLGDGRYECYACAHRCPIAEGFDGVCKVRGIRDGQLMVPTGYVAGLQVDPIEKKPFFHVLPGNGALSFGMLGCDLHCGYCQNWLSSQVLRDKQASARPRDVDKHQLIQVAEKGQVPVLVSTYNEPLITSEWAVEIFTEAKASGFLCGYVSNGNATAEVLDFIRPFVDLYKVDLKSFDDSEYRKLGAPLKHILEGIRMIFERGFWLEIVSLIVPGLNDSDKQLHGMAQFLAEISVNIPWHITAYRPMYKADANATPASTLIRAAKIGQDHGLRYIYCGNRPGQVEKFENTYCHHCQALLIQRRSFKILKNRIGPNGLCPDCTTQIPGIWDHPRSSQRPPEPDPRPRSIWV
jgi:pyruvate formate lyase activating enzyme